MCNHNRDRYQGQLIKDKIVPSVLLELKKNCMVIADNLVGMDHHENEIVTLLSSVDKDVRIVGIHGMGGIGKTTIAKCIYNKLLESFECRTFLADIREMAEQHNGLVDLQKQLLNDTLNMVGTFTTVDKGIKEIKDKFLQKKLLIVLDDVNKRSHFDCLVGNRDWYCKGSTIIVTTRDKHVLNALQVDGAYQPQVLNPEQSLQLLSIHAFRKNSPPTAFDSISREVASTAAGLPLNLEVIGSFLVDKGKVVWEDTLKKLKKIPDDQVQRKLRISYDELNYEQQQIFLDIACFFIGTDKKYAFYMWDDCGYYPEKEITVLCLKSLVKMGDDNVIRMHDQLRDLGREIIRQENSKKPGRRSRLWDQDEALYVLECQRGREEVEALFLEYLDDEELQYNYRFTKAEEFTKLFNLRFLHVKRVEFVGDFKHLLSRLRWLILRNCSDKFNATNFHPKNLVILDLSYNLIRDDWEGWSQIKMAKKLKVLALRESHYITATPDFSTYESLEILNLQKCFNLNEIGRSIGNLKNLKELDISNCHSLKKLADEIWMLEKLEVIDASRCYRLKGDIPSNMGRLSSLRFLSFSDTKFKSVPTSIRELTNLQTLNLLWNNDQFRLLPELPSSLKTLQVAFCIRHVANLVNLKELYLHGLVKMEEVPNGIGKLSNLETLSLKNSSIRALPKEVSDFSQLKVLNIELCEDFQPIYSLPSSLVELSLRACGSLKRLPLLSNLKILFKFSVKECDNLTELQGLGKLASLTSLHIRGCSQLADLQGVGKLGSLTSLHISSCYQLANLQGLEKLGSLTSLYISGSDELAEIDLLDRGFALEMSQSKYLEKDSYPSSLRKLKTLNISSCPKLYKIQGLDRLESLEHLELGPCRSIVRLPTLSNLQQLEHLSIWECPELNEIRGLEKLKLLQYLNLSGCRLIERLPNLSNLEMLTTLNVKHCEMLPKIEGLETLKHLEALDVTGCKSLEELPHLPKVYILRDLPSEDPEAGS